MSAKCHEPTSARLFELFFPAPERSTDFIQAQNFLVLGRSDYELSLQCRERYIRPTIALGEGRKAVPYGTIGQPRPRLLGRLSK